MKPIHAIQMSHLPFEGLEEYSELLSYDGIATLVHNIDSSKQNILKYWVDFDKGSDRWFYFKLSDQEVYDYISANKTLRSIIENINAEFSFFVDTNTNNEVMNIVMIYSRAYPQFYLPSIDSYLEDDLQADYSWILDRFSFSQRLQEIASIFYVKSKSIVHLDTVGAKDAAFALSNAANSMEGFVRVKAKQKLMDAYPVEMRRNKRINALVKQLSPRIAKTEDHSFEVWLSFDIISFHPDNDPDSDLRNSIIKDYREDVLNVDFSNTEQAESISEKYSENERKLIYEPLFKLFENENIEVSIYDYSLIEQKTKKSTVLDQKFKNVIFPPPTLEAVQEEMNKKSKLVSVVMSLKEDENISTLSKKQILDNTLYFVDFAETVYPIDSPIEFEETTVYLDRPLPCILRIDTEGNLELSNSELELVAKGTDMKELIEGIKKQFIDLYVEYQEKRPNKEDIFKELENYLT